jgi:UDP-2,3-diacylglucosamine hydrolase
MRLSTISDLHIRCYSDEGYKTFTQFCEHPLVQTSTHVGLLGDIFDLMAGDHQEYVTRWEHFFLLIQNLCESGKVVYYFEGNHDMHLKVLFKRVVRNWPIEVSHRFIHVSDSVPLDLLGFKIIIGHGDEYNRTDVTYLKYKRFIKRKPLGFVANHLMPLGVLDYLGHKASIKSRKYGAKKFDFEKIRQLNREGVSDIHGKDFDIIIGGHTHIVEEWKTNGFIYLNNGFPQRSKMFSVVDSEGARLVSLL